MSATEGEGQENERPASKPVEPAPEKKTATKRKTTARKKTALKTATKKPVAKKRAATGKVATKKKTATPSEPAATKKTIAKKAAATKKTAAEKAAARKRVRGKLARRKPARPTRPLPVIGWREWVAAPELGIGRIKAKADTGARTSALHAVGVRVDGDRVRFRVHPLQRDTRLTVQCSAPLVGYRRVRSSSGDVTERPVILTRLVIADRSWEIEVTLVRRELMGFRMLLGRRAVRRRLRVDPGRSFLAGEPHLP